MCVDRQTHVYSVSRKSETHKQNFTYTMWSLFQTMIYSSLFYKKIRSTVELLRCHILNNISLIKIKSFQHSHCLSEQSECLEQITSVYRFLLRYSAQFRVLLAYSLDSTREATSCTRNFVSFIQVYGTAKRLWVSLFLDTLYKLY